MIVMCIKLFIYYLFIVLYILAYFLINMVMTIYDLDDFNMSLSILKHD
jgi:hypothetical protein